MRFQFGFSSLVFATAIALGGCSGGEGPAGADGATGTNGVDGNDGNDGIACWDTNRNGVDDASEDTNSDGAWDTADCQGNPGSGGLDCWDLNGDGITDANEDTNSDGAWNTLDCYGTLVPPSGYVGSAACGACHDEEHAGWQNSGHPYKIVPKALAQAGTGYPAYVQAAQGEVNAIDGDFFTDQAALMTITADTFPNGGWDDVSYIIGGYGWKARFIGTDGYIITGSDGGTPNDKTDDSKVQFNFPFDPELSAQDAYGPVGADTSSYHAGQQLPYDCGGCHTTGWVADTDAATDNDLTDNQDGLPGIYGTWVEPGVGCEDCHGPGALHASDPRSEKTQGDPDAACFSCHVRGYKYAINTEDGYIEHHEQGEELIQSRHAAIGCTGCHDPHQPVRYQDEYIALEGDTADPNPNHTNNPGVRVDCVSCHVVESLAYDDWARDYGSMAYLDCTDCHMPGAAKSGHAVGTYYADVASHLMSINVGADFYADPAESTAAGPEAKPYLTLDWACGGCHADLVDDPTFDFFTWASSRAAGLHGRVVDEPPAQTYVGMSTCATCHPDHAANVIATGHPYKIVPATAAAAGTGYPAYVQAAQGEVNAIDADFWSDQTALTGSWIPADWSSVSYIIGGYGWKARFMDAAGYIMTGSDNVAADPTDDDKVQFNFPFDPKLQSNGKPGPVPASAAAYHAGEVRPYTCGACHTTGWVPNPDPTDLTANQDGLAGIHGKWAEPGVTCEACHGPGSEHTKTPLAVPMSVKAAAESCGQCHHRGADWFDINTSGGFIRHHEQYEELTAGKHFGKLQCVTCHDPHRPVKYAAEFIASDGLTDDPVPGTGNNFSGIKRQCVDCHAEYQTAFENSGTPYALMSNVTCVDCHMARASKSAVEASQRCGDLRTHIFKIDPTVDVETSPDLNTTGGTSGGANPYLSLDWSCGGCHNEELPGGTGSFAGVYDWAWNNPLLTPADIHPIP